MASAGPGQADQWESGQGVNDPLSSQHREVVGVGGSRVRGTEAEVRALPGSPTVR